MLLRSIHHVLHINRSLAVLSLWQSLARRLTKGQSLPPLSHTLTHTRTHTHTHAHTHNWTHISTQTYSLYLEWTWHWILLQTPWLLSTHVHMSVSCFCLSSSSHFLSLSFSLSLSSRCGWAGESCSSQTVHLPCSAKRPESSGRARAKGCSPRETASLHKPAGEDRWLLTRGNCTVSHS